MSDKKKVFDENAKPQGAQLTAKKQMELTAQLAVEMAKAFPEAGSVSAQMGGIKITLKQRQPK